MVCPVCYENPIIRQVSQAPKVCDHKGVCQKCKEAWEKGCFRKMESATCPLCRKVVATDWSSLLEMMTKTQKALESLK